MSSKRVYVDRALSPGAVLELPPAAALHLAKVVRVRSGDPLVLFTGDGDFRRLVEAVQRKGVRVSVVSTVKTQPAMVSDDLRRQADSFIDLADLQPVVARTPNPNHAHNHAQQTQAHAPAAQ